MRPSLTRGEARATNRPMARLFSLFAMLALSLSLTVGSVAHAQSSIACAEIAQAVDGDADASGDQMPGGCKMGCLHHASCHGHHVMVTSGDTAGRSTAIAEAQPFPRSEAALAGASRDPALRPPQA